MERDYDYIAFSDVDALANKYVEARTGSFVTAKAGSKVDARDLSYVVAHKGSYVTAYEGSHVIACNGSYVSAHEDSVVEAWEGSKVTAWNGSHVTRHRNSHVMAHKGSIVETGDDVTQGEGLFMDDAKAKMTLDTMTYTYTLAVDDATRIWVRYFQPPPGTYHPYGCQMIEVLKTGYVEVVNDSVENITTMAKQSDRRGA